MLRFDSIRFAYGETPVLNDVSFTAEAGAVTCLVGPSGCGKSTLLRLAAGLLPLQQGEILIDDTRVSAVDVHVPPEERSVGLVFQEGALFPHLTVLDNVRFGVRDPDGSGRVDELINLTHLDELVDRYPHELSGGQRQRVALARAIAPAPRVLLFDEPYANLDQALRRQLRDEARRLVTSLDTVAVFVTHDHEDVTALADKVVAIDDGVVVQTGTTRQLFDHPEHASVARLFGLAQRVPGQLKGDAIETPFGRWPAGCLAVPPPDKPTLILLVRPDGLVIEASPDGLPVTELKVAGADDLVGVQGEGDAEIHARVTRPHELRTGSRVAIRPLPGRVFPVSVANGTHSQ